MGGQTSKITPKERDEFLESKISVLVTSAPSQGEGLIQPLLKVNHKDILEDILQTLALANVSSVPVYKSSDNKTDFGLVDTLDVVAYISLKYKELGETEFLKQSPKVLKTQVEQVIDFSHQDPMIPVDIDNSIQQVLEKMITFKAHRVVILDEKKSIHSLLTQSFLVKFIARNIEKLISDPDRSLKEEGWLGSKNVYCVQSTMKTADAFVAMYQQKITAVGVINKKGVLVGALSANDVRGMTRETIVDLMLPVREFLFKKQSRYVSCTSMASIRSLLNVLVSQSLHRIFIVDNQKKPVAIVTLTDILNKVLRVP